MTRPDAIVFDIGEVLLRLDFSRLFAELRFEKGAQVSSAMESLERWTLYDAFERGTFDELEFQQRIETSLGRTYAAEQFRALWNSVIVGPIDGIELVIERLASQVPLYALSNSNVIHMRHVRETYPWFSHLRAVLSSHELGSRKPEPLIYEKALSTVGLPRGARLFIDDREENVHGARRAGFVAEHCVRAPRDLVAILVRHGFTVA